MSTVYYCQFCCASILTQKSTMKTEDPLYVMDNTLLTTDNSKLDADERKHFLRGKYSQSLTNPCVKRTFTMITKATMRQKTLV